MNIQIKDGFECQISTNRKVTGPAKMTELHAHLSKWTFAGYFQMENRF